MISRVETLLSLAKLVLALGAMAMIGALTLWRLHS